MLGPPFRVPGYTSFTFTFIIAVPPHILSGRHHGSRIMAACWTCGSIGLSLGLHRPLITTFPLEQLDRPADKFSTDHYVSRRTNCLRKRRDKRGLLLSSPALYAQLQISQCQTSIQISTHETCNARQTRVFFTMAQASTQNSLPMRPAKPLPLPLATKCSIGLQVRCPV